MNWFDDPTGLLLSSLLVSAIATVPISRVILAVYRRHIRVLMGRGNATPIEPHIERPGARAALLIERASALERNASVPRARTSFAAPQVYVAAGIVWAAAATALRFAFDPTISPTLAKTVALGGAHLWPVLPAVARMAAWSRRAEMLAPFSLLGVTLLVGALLGDGVVTATISIWVFAMLPPSATFQLVSRLGVPSIGPWVAGFLVAWLVATYLGLAGVLSFVETSDFVKLVLVTGVLGTAFLLGRGVVRRVARLSLGKRVSEEMLSADVWWIVFTGWLCVWLSAPGDSPSEKWFGVLAGTLPFVAYRCVVALGLRAAKPEPPGPRLLLLRVFGQRSKSEALLNSIGRRWRRYGSIQLIAAPDVASVTLDPQGLLDFLSGRLGRAFISDAESLETRLTDLDLAPDPDGTHRVTKFFCHRDAWRITLQRLVGDADSVLMDLRGFGRDNAGCIYELGQLVDLVPTDRVVLMVDRTTDKGFLESTLLKAWSRLRVDSPNRGEAPSPLRIVSADESDADPVGTVLAALGATVVPSARNSVA